jgi:decaprenylphospho-beta-D-erythro-pentofuranosid-2-ulose 2-reductase
MRETKTALIIGATSIIAQEAAKIYAEKGWSLILAGRDVEEMKIIGRDLQIRYGGFCRVVAFDAENKASAARAARAVLAKGCPDVVLFFHGIIGDGAEDALNEAGLRKVNDVTYASIPAFMSYILPEISEKNGAAIGFVSSVAGDRGRKTNLIYGAAKAALNVYAQGLRGALFERGVSVLTVKLGYVDTRLAFGLAPKLMTCSAAYAARAICRAIEKRKDVIYLPWFWRWVMLVLRLIPECLFKRLTLP